MINTAPKATSSNQLNAFEILKLFADCKSHKRLHITDRDIYIKGSEFVFGASLLKKCAIVSTKRIDGVFHFVQVLKHETGHLMGLGHCQPPCVMAFSKDCQDSLMKKDVKFCKKCLNGIKSIG